MHKLSRRRMAELVAADIEPNTYVNLGIGMPTLVADHLDPDCGIVLHSENGILGMRGLRAGERPDPDLMNATKEPVMLTAGASITDHVVSFSMMRGGHIDLTVLGAFQVSARGDLANWDTGRADSIPAVGGAMDLVAGARKVFVMMQHQDKDGLPKIVSQCTYPLTGSQVVDRIYTDLAIIDIRPDGLEVRGMVAGLAFDQLQKSTGVPLRQAATCVVLVP
ncbi:3-oxoacid CoA-transferase subunit B [Bordetella petrii]|uniref:3-oxoacid CoA-transferase subunit B n=1 Tax=Bordetella petrii TaxID=94624 RepID=A0ABT7W6N5_9BORD|nr:3-oxoacid CoA-transferase subunit B [Bordetella petrii]MDM9560863.1 3-oxoacid CoA-transferase subunit B [Bordetella petrii]